MRLDDVFAMTKYVEMRDEGFVRRQVHPTLPLAILNYSEKAQFSREWNEVTLACRGLIYNYQTNEVLARPFPKFFNWDDSTQPYPPHGPVLRSPKMDGSLGVLYLTGDKYVPWMVATRGSFASDQALWAMKKIYKLHSDDQIDLEDLRSDKTYLVEIIFPENRIVVDYKGTERLVLLDVIDTATGKADLDEFERVYWLDKVQRVYLPGGFQDTMASEIPEGEEGFVIYWPERDYRVKMKSADYLALHRMIFSLSERSIWQRLGEGETIEGICVKLPDEFHSWVKGVAEQLFVAQAEIMHLAGRDYRECLATASLADDISNPRAAFAQFAKRYSTRAYLFMLYDGKDIAEAVWKTLRPEGNKGINTISEDVA